MRRSIKLQIGRKTSLRLCGFASRFARDALEGGHLVSSNFIIMFWYQCSNIMVRMMKCMTLKIFLILHVASPLYCISLFSSKHFSAIAIFFMAFTCRTPLEAILVINGRRALILFWKFSEKNEKWHHFCAHAQWWSPWRRKNVEKGHLAPSSLTFLLIKIDRNGFCRLKEEGHIYKKSLRFF